jgi:hypothetical protein
MPAIIPIVAATIAAGGAIAASSISSSAAKKVAGQAQQTAAANNQLQTDIYGQNKAELDPYAQRGNTAGSYIQSLLGLDGSPEAKAKADAAFQQYLGSTGYQFALDQGTRAATSGAAARGSLQSGATMRALAQYGQGLAAQRFQGFLGNVQTQQDTGLRAASALAGVGQGYASSVSANNNAALDASGNATLTGAANTTSAVTGLANIAAGALGQSSYRPNSVAQPRPSVGASPVFTDYGGG